MFEKLNDVEKLYEELAERLADPNIVDDIAEYHKVAKQHNDLTEVVTRIRE